MPRYDYDCAACGTRFEVAHGVTAEPPTACPVCGSASIKKAFAPPTIHFKGSGWAKKERRATVAPGSTRTAGGDTAATAGEASDAKSGEMGGDKSGDTGKGEAAVKPDPPAKSPASATPGSAAD